MTTNMCPCGTTQRRFKLKHFEKIWNIFLEERDVLEDGVSQLDVFYIEVECGRL